MKTLSEIGAKNLSVGIGIYGPNEKSETHAHKNEEEVMFVLRGSGRLILKDAAYKMEGGTVIHVPPGEEHQIENTGNEVLEFLFVYAPLDPDQSIKRWPTL